MDEISILKYIFAFGFVIGLLYLMAYIARYFGLGNLPTRRLGDKKRLAISEILTVDAKRRLVIVKADEKEYLLLTGGTNDLIIDTELKPSKKQDKKAPKDKKHHAKRDKADEMPK